MADLASAVYKSRAELMNRTRSVSPANGPRTLAEVIQGADAFLGLSAGGVLKQAMVAKLLILVLTNR